MAKKKEEVATQETSVAKVNVAAEIENVLINGDLKSLTPTQRVQYYRNLCDSVGLNPLTRPFDYITFQGKLTLYANRNCTDQLRFIHRVSIQIVSREIINGVFVVVARSIHPDGRQDESIGAVKVQGLQGDALAHAMMKCETKSKRRVTLSSCGLSLLDETETETIAGAQYPDRMDVEYAEMPQIGAPAAKAEARQDDDESLTEAIKTGFAMLEIDEDEQKEWVEAHPKPADLLAALKAQWRRTHSSHDDEPEPGTDEDE